AEKGGVLLISSLFLADGCAPQVDDPSRGDAIESSLALYFPPKTGEWETVDPEDVGWSSDGLEKVFDVAQRNNSTGMVLLHRGRILAERYWTSFPEAVSEDEAWDYLAGTNKYYDTEGRPVDDVASVQKSVVSFLVGMARERGLLDIDRPVSAVLGDGWSNSGPDSEGLITIRHLLTMTSGLDEGRNLRTPAGEAWRYSTGAYSQVMRVLETVTGLDLQRLTEEWLLASVGMNESLWILRPWAGPDSPNQFGFATSARDAARFGLLVLAEGSWDGKQILDPSFVSDMLAPSQDINPSYGLLWWLNGQEAHRLGDGTERLGGPLIEIAPDDLVAARGAWARRIYVVPSLDLVVTRLGTEPPGPESGKALRFSRELWAALMEASPNQ
ncbi:serine hydrolase domain-containing protein, partial [Gemmatimonadota bacterium]